MEQSFDYFLEVKEAARVILRRKPRANTDWT